MLRVEQRARVVPSRVGDRRDDPADRRRAGTALLLGALLSASIALVGCRSSVGEEAGAGQGRRAREQRKPQRIASPEPVEVTAVSVPGPSPAAFRVQVRPDRLDVDSEGWARRTAAEPEAAMLAREAAFDTDFVLPQIPTADRRNHLLPSLYDALSERQELYAVFEANLKQRPLVVALEIAPAVDMGLVGDVIYTVGRVGVVDFDLALGTAAGPGHVRLRGPDPFGLGEVDLCRQRALAVANDGVFVSMMWTRPPADPTLGIVGVLAADAAPPRQPLLGPDGACPAVAVQAGVIDLAALDARLAELPDDGCSMTAIVFEADVPWSTAAPLLAHLDRRGATPTLYVGIEGATGCDGGVRPEGLTPRPAVVEPIGEGEIDRPPS